MTVSSPGSRRRAGRKAALIGLGGLSLTLLLAGLTGTEAEAARATDTPQNKAAEGAKKHKAPAGFVALEDVDPTILQDMRYTTDHSFLGEPFQGYREPICILSTEAANALHRVQEKLRPRGYSLKMYDCYRPERAADQAFEWSKDLTDQRMKTEFYPRVDKSRIFPDNYLAEKSAHSRGSAIDVTLVKLPAEETRPYESGEPLVPCHSPQDERFPDNSVDMGTGFDCFDPASHTDDQLVNEEQKANRALLRNSLAAEGFKGIPTEWWHYTLAPEPFPETYFDFPVHHSALRGR